MSIPPEAIQAAVKALKDTALLNNAGYLPGDEEWAAEAVIEAAAPLLAAAERERIRQLALAHDATGAKCAQGISISGVCGCRSRNPRFPFADLLEPAP